MRVFVLLRSLFFGVLLTVISVFVAHKQLCINYTPHGLEGIMKNCEESLNSITRVIERSHSKRNGNVSEVLESAVGRNDLHHNSSMELEDGGELDENSTRIHDVVRRKRSDESNDGDAEKSLIEHVRLAEQWHRIPFDNEEIQVNVRTCFDFSIYDIWNEAVPKFSNIVAPIRLTFILIVTSLLLAILDMSSRFIIHRVSIFQCLAYSFVQVVLWGYILVRIEMYRRYWIGTWLTAGQLANEIPMYPMEWVAVELHAFTIMMLSILEAVLFKYLPQRIRLLNSQGVYKCIHPDNAPENGQEDCLD